jgi:hypothetical protein
MEAVAGESARAFVIGASLRQHGMFERDRQWQKRLDPWYNTYGAGASA